MLLSVPTCNMTPCPGGDLPGVTACMHACAPTLLSLSPTRGRWEVVSCLVQFTVLFSAYLYAFPYPLVATAAHATVEVEEHLCPLQELPHACRGCPMPVWPPSQVCGQWTDGKAGTSYAQLLPIATFFWMGLPSSPRYNIA